MAKYRVRRDLPDNTYTQVKATDLAECKRVLRSIKGKWDDVKAMGTFNGGEPFVTKLSAKKLVVTRGEDIVDQYVIERV